MQWLQFGFRIRHHALVDGRFLDRRDVKNSYESDCGSIDSLWLRIELWVEASCALNMLDVYGADTST